MHTMLGRNYPAPPSREHGIGLAAAPVFCPLYFQTHFFAMHRTAISVTGPAVPVDRPGRCAIGYFAYPAADLWLISLAPPPLRPLSGVRECQSMSHEKRIVICCGPSDPHAFHGISVQPRSGDLDLLCPDCFGHGQWNGEIDLVSQRSKRVFCETCDTRGWIETGDDLVASHDILLSEDGQPGWIVRMGPPDPD
jgi:hypothetical protein